MFTLLCKGHLADPLSAFAYSTLTTCRRVIARHPEFKPKLLESLGKRQQDPSSSHIGGPVQALLAAAEVCGALVDVNATLGFCRIGEAEPALTLDIDHPNRGDFEHVVRESLRRQEWASLARRRPNFGGLQDGVDRVATLVLQRRVLALDRYRLRCIMSGAVNTRAHLHRVRVVESPTCPCCGQAPETWSHLFAECPAHATIRNRELGPELLESLPACLRLHGVCPETFQFGDSRDDLLGLVGTVQYMLLDVLAHRNELMGEPPPQPRWTTA